MHAQIPGSTGSKTGNRIHGRFRSCQRNEAGRPGSELLMISRQELRDRRAVLAALTATGPAAITLLGLYSLTALPEQRVQAALAYLEAQGLVHRLQESSGLPGPWRTRYRVRT